MYLLIWIRHRNISLQVLFRVLSIPYLVYFITVRSHPRSAEVMGQSRVAPDARKSPVMLMVMMDVEIIQSVYINCFGCVVYMFP